VQPVTKLLWTILFIFCASNSLLFINIFVSFGMRDRSAATSNSVAPSVERVGNNKTVKKNRQMAATASKRDNRPTDDTRPLISHSKRRSATLPTRDRPTTKSSTADSKGYGLFRCIAVSYGAVRHRNGPYAVCDRLQVIGRTSI